jgi:hypothetical protein
MGEGMTLDYVAISLQRQPKSGAGTRELEFSFA